MVNVAFSDHVSQKSCDLPDLNFNADVRNRQHLSLSYEFNYMCMLVIPPCINSAK